MLREIKFRAWHNTTKTMHFNVGITPDGWVFNGSSNNVNEGALGDIGEDCELMQFTGLKDKNEKEIYEGDIYKIDDIVAQIIFKNGCFCGSRTGYGKPLTWDNEEWDMFNEEIEIIGNIHQNSELLTPSTK